MVKANIGGSGAGITRYASEEELARSIRDGSVPDSVDSVLLVQDYVPARGGAITRVETLGGKFLYAIEVESAGDSFDLCPADACLAQPGRAAVRMTAVQPPAELVEAAERIAQAVGLDVGGVEYLVDDRDGTPLFYDINALSNFVAKPLDVLGWDPHDRLVDYAGSAQIGRAAMRFGYWMPVFGGWLRNIPDEGMEASWDYVRRLTQRSEQTGWDLSLIAELNLNDIKGVEEPALDAWSTAAALAAVTETHRADGRGAAQFPPARPVRQGGGQYRQYQRRPARAQRRLLLVGGRGDPIWPPVRPA